MFGIKERVGSRLVAVDLTDAAAAPGFVTAMFRKPSGEVVSVTCEVDTPTTAGLAFYATAEGFLDELGDWEAQAFVFIPGTTSGDGFFPSAIVTFRVLELLRPFSFQGPGPALATVLPLVLPSVTRAP